MSVNRTRTKGKFYVYVYLDPRKPGKFIYGDYEFDKDAGGVI